MAKLLIVDDEPFTVEVLQVFLQMNGFETVSALNGSDGLLLVEIEQPDLMILDLMLPDLEGYEVCRRLRNATHNTHLPVLILSARVEAGSKRRAAEAGANAYLTKPVDFPELLHALNHLLAAAKNPTHRDNGA